LYTLLGSVFILIALLAFYFTNVRDFVPQHRVADLRNQIMRDDKNLTAEQADERVVVNTFDLVLLQRVGKAALQYMDNGGDVSKVTDVPSLERLRREAGTGSDEAEAKLKAAEAKVKERWDAEPFFKPWFQYTMFIFLFIGFA